MNAPETEAETKRALTEAELVTLDTISIRRIRDWIEEGLNQFPMYEEPLEKALQECKQLLDLREQAE